MALKLVDTRHRMPVAAQQLAHRGAGADLGEPAVLLGAQHLGVLTPA